MDTIVFHNTFGLGKVLDNIQQTNAELSKVVFSGGSEKTMLNSFLKRVDSAYPECLENEKDANTAFPEDVLCEAKEKYDGKNVKIVAYHDTDNRFSMIVDDCGEFYTSVFLNGNTVESECSCEKHSNCIHGAMSYLRLRDSFTLLHNAAGLEEGNKEKAEISNVIDACLKDISAENSLVKVYERLKNLTYALPAVPGDELIEKMVRDYLDCYEIKKTKRLTAVIDFLAYGPLRDRFDKVFDDADIKRNFYAELRMFRTEYNTANAIATGRWFNEAHSRSEFFYYFNDRDDSGSNGVRAVLNHSTLNSDIYRYLLLYFAALCKNRNFLICSLDEFLHHSATLSKNASHAILACLEGKEKLEIIENHPDLFVLDAETVRQLPVELRMDLLPRIIQKRSDFRMIDDEILDYRKKEPKIFAKLIERIYQVHYFNRDMEQILKDYLAEMPGGIYMKNYLLNHDCFASSTSYDSIDWDAFFALFSYQLAPSARGEDYWIVAEIDSPADTKVCYFCIDDRGTVYDRYRNQFSWDENSMGRYIGRYLSEHEADKLELLFEPLRTAAEQRINERKKRELKNSIANLSAKLFVNSIPLRNERRIAIQCILQEMDGKLYLELRVCNQKGKAFVVKDIEKFLMNVRESLPFQYGKGLEFNHDITNFDDNAQQVLSVLLKADLNPDGRVLDSRHVCLRGYVLWDILEKLKGGKISFAVPPNAASEYSVRLEEKEMRVYVDRDLFLSTNLDASNLLYNLDGHLLLVNQRNGVMDTVLCDKQTASLFLFAQNYSGTNLSPAIEEFKCNVYPRASEHIELADEIKDDFRSSSLEINAYFDYEKKAIVCRTKFLRGSQEIAESKIKSPAECSMISLCREYLTSLGFASDVPEKFRVPDGEMYLTDDADVLQFFSMDFAGLKRYCTVYLSDSIKNAKINVFKPPVVRIRYDGTMMKAFVDSGEFAEEELSDILKAIRHRKKYVVLNGDRILRVDSREAAEFGSTVDDLDLDEDHMMQEQQVPMATSLRAFAHESNCTIDDYLISMIRDIKSFKTADIEIPAVNAELREYQKEGFRWMKIVTGYHMGCILADDMGLGKTLEVITLLASDKEDKPSLVVCPKSLVFNWKSEFAKFAPDIPVTEIYGIADERKVMIQNISDKEKRVYITSYDSLRNDREEYTRTFNYMILDEAQFIKNINAQKSVSVKEIDASHKIALTGTPIENDIIDLWSIFDFIMPGYFEKINVFKSRFETDEDFAGVVAKRVAPFILRRTKGDVLLDLPEKTERIVSAEMTTEQRKVYEAYKLQVRQALADHEKAFDVLPMLTRLRQICVAPEMFIEGYQGGSGKMDLLGELIDDYVRQGHRLLIFSQFVKALDCVRKILETKNVRYFVLTGETKSADRIRLVDDFNANDDIKVFLISLKAGGTGLNLIGADTVVHIDPWWNVAAENQATDRSHRIGQKKNVEVIKLICENTIEQRVIELQNLKKDIVDRVISNSDQSVTNATLEDIAFVLD